MTVLVGTCSAGRGRPLPAVRRDARPPLRQPLRRGRWRTVVGRRRAPSCSRLSGRGRAPPPGPGRAASTGGARSAAICSRPWPGCSPALARNGRCRRARRPALGPAADARSARARASRRARSHALLVVATFRTTAPDRSDEVAARVAELHRLEGVRPPRPERPGHRRHRRVRAPPQRRPALASCGPPPRLLRDRTGGNPFFLRELWADLERRGGVSALRLAPGCPGVDRRHPEPRDSPGSARRPAT